MEHYGKLSLCPLKYYICGSLFNESALEMLIFGNSVCLFFTCGGHHSLSSTQQLCPVDVKMQSVIVACTYLQMQAWTSAVILTSTPSDAKTSAKTNVTKTTKPPVKKEQVF